MARLIDADARIAEIKKAYCTGCENYNGVRCRACWVDDAIGMMDDAPTVDAVPVVHGEWCEDYETFIDDSGKESFPIQTGYVCSECGKDGYPNWHYCPNCGAKNGRLV